MVWKPFFVTPRVPASPRPFHINPLAAVASVPGVVRALELEEDRGEECVAVVLPPRLEAQRRRRLHRLARKLVRGVVDVDADAEDDATLRRLREDAGHL